MRIVRPTLKWARKDDMNLIIAGISIFGLGWVANELTSVPTAAIIGVCFVAQLVVLVVFKKIKRTK
jgi:hypothetical protein